MITEPSILAAIDATAAELEVTGPFDRRAILAALTDVETGPWGSRWQAALFEPGYYRGGHYYNVEHVREAVHRYESLASCSYGPWQILYISAWELGYRGHPVGLISPEVSAPLVVELLNRRWKDKGRLDGAADSWNTGNDHDRLLPRATYTENFLQAYDEALVHYAAADTEATW